MTDDDRELVRHLFAEAMRHIDDASEHAVSGQATDLSNREYTLLGHAMVRSANNLARIGKAISAIGEPCGSEQDD